MQLQWSIRASEVLAGNACECNLLSLLFGKIGARTDLATPRKADKQPKQAESQHMRLTNAFSHLGDPELLMVCARLGDVMAADRPEFAATPIQRAAGVPMMYDVIIRTR
jgi:hypothetical protein